MPSKNLQPALVGGLFLGVLSALPIVKYGNCLCCMWVIGGGLIAAYLLQNASQVAIGIGDGAVTGLLAGLFGAVVGAILGAIFALIMGPFEVEAMRRLIDQNPDMPPWFRDAFENGRRGPFLVFQFVGFLISLCVYAVFATIGGMIGASIFSRGKPTVMAAEPPPPPPPIG